MSDPVTTPDVIYLEPKCDKCSRVLHEWHARGGSKCHGCGKPAIKYHRATPELEAALAAARTGGGAS